MVPQYKILKEDGKEYVAEDIQTIRKWLKEKRIKPSEQVFHPVQQRWLYIKDMAELDEGLQKDKLEPYWYAIIWCSLIIPFAGVWIIVILSSVMYYVWRREFPNKARTINLH